MHLHDCNIKIGDFFYTEINYKIIMANKVMNTTYNIYVQ